MRSLTRRTPTGVINDAQVDVLGGSCSELERFYSWVVQSNRTRGTRLVNMFDMGR